MTTANKLYTIKDISDITGVHAQTLRNWEKEKLIEPIRVAGNQRIYNDDHVNRVKEIISLKEEGFQLKGVRNVLIGRTKSAGKAVKDKANSVKNRASKAVTAKNEKRNNKQPLMSAAQTLEKTGSKKPGRPAKKTDNKAVENKAVESKAVESKAVESKATETKSTPKRSKYSVNKLNAMTLKELTKIAQKEDVRYFRQMFKEELVIAISDPSRREEMKEQAKQRTKERYGHKVYGERGRNAQEQSGEEKEEKLLQYAQTQEENKGTGITEENAVSDEGLVEANVVEDAKEEMDNQQLLIKQILDLGNSGKSPEEIAKELAKSYK